MSTYEELVSRVRSILEDNSAVRFSSGLLASAIRQGLARIDECLPQVISTEVEAGAAGRDQLLEGLVNCLYIIQLNYPATDGSDIELEPEAQFSYTMQQGVPMVHFSGAAVPQAGDVMQVRYAAQNTLEGLDGDEMTSLSQAALSALATGAAGHACWLRAGSIAHDYGAKAAESAALVETGRLWLNLFDRSLEGLRVLQEFGFPMGFRLDEWDRHGR